MTPVLGIIASSNQQGRGGGPVGSYDALASITIPAGQTAASIVFAGIPSGYRHLQVRAFITPGTSSGDSYAYLQFNNDTSASYAWHRLGGSGNTAGSSAATSQTSIASFLMTGAANSNLYPAPTVLDILDYAAANKFKTTRALTGLDQNTNSGVGGTSQLNLFSGLWQSTNPITSITISPNPLVVSFKAYSSFALYGVK